MKREFYEGMTFTDLPLLALVLFVALFVGVVIRAWVMKPRAHFDALSRLPFDDGQVKP